MNSNPRFSNPNVASSSLAAPANQRKPPKSQQVTPLRQLQQSDSSGERSHPPSAGRSAEPGRTIPPSVDCTQKLYLRCAIDHTLSKIEADTTTLTKKQWKDYERLRQLLRMYRSTGRVNWPAVGFATAAMLFTAAMLKHYQPVDLLYCESCTPSTKVRILEQYNDYDFQIQRVVAGIPQAPEVHRFHEKLPLEIGFTLKKLQVEDKGDYWTTAPFQLPYIIERYPGTVMPTLPENCHQDPVDPIYGRVSCSGRPKFKY